MIMIIIICFYECLMIFIQTDLKFINKKTVHKYIFNWTPSLDKKDTN